MILRKPKKEDGKKIYELVSRSKPLDLNSKYLYLLQSTHFSNLCCVASNTNEIYGFVSGYIHPNSPNIYFVWQVAVDESCKGKGLALKMLRHILEDPILANIDTVQTTISPSNSASQKVFEKLAKHYGATIQKSILFEKDDFGGEHEEEVLFSISPIKKKEKNENI